jgi:hypothetical protein
MALGIEHKDGIVSYALNQQTKKFGLNDLAYAGPVD